MYTIFHSWFTVLCIANGSSMFSGTSGDTGSAAIESVKALNWVDIIVFFPKNRCSEVQELQMTTVIKDNVHIFRGWY